MLLTAPLLAEIPRRIVSLVPSQTALLFELGLESQIAGITVFCTHPAHARLSKTMVGGTKNIRMTVIDSLQPDLVIANREENTRTDVEAIAVRYPVWVTDVHDLPSALAMIRDMGSLTGTVMAAEKMIQQISAGFRLLQPSRRPLRTAYLIWRKPWMAAGGDTFIHAMLQHCGWDNVFSQVKRYPVTSPAELSSAGCELLLLSSEPYPFSEKHRMELQSALPGTDIRLVNGEPFSWYGSHLLDAPAYFQQLIRETGGEQIT